MGGKFVKLILFATVVIEVILTVRGCCRTVDYEWDIYKNLYNKNYKNEEDEREHKCNWGKSKNIIKESSANIPFKIAINQFADMNDAEFNQHKGLQMPPNTNRTRKRHVRSKRASFPETLDWREKNLVSEVKDQGSCGSCWAFSVAGTLEGQVAKKTGKLVPLSPQWLVDCSDDPSTDGCTAGSMIGAYEWLMKRNGTEPNEAYPYRDNKETCKYNATTLDKNAKVVSYHVITEGSDYDLVDALVNVGPLSIALDSSANTFKFYSGGIYESACSQYKMDHAVLLVGYGLENGKLFWLVKNSWSTKWGENGYMKLSASSRNFCGISSMASYPVIHK